MASIWLSTSNRSRTYRNDGHDGIYYSYSEMSMNLLSQSTIEKVGYYVYLLIDPRTDKVFYVGKGCGNRINHHLLGALEEKTKETGKIKRIREIQKEELEVEHTILRHGLTEKEAFEVESAVIDLLGLENLTNLMHGHHSLDRGKMTLKNIKTEYEAVDALFDEPVMLIRINQLYRYEMPANELYEVTRKHWKVGSRAKTIHIACAVYAGIVREVYSINEWVPSPETPGRFMFIGEVAPPGIRQKYLDKSVAHVWKQGSQNPIKYVG